MHGPHRTRRSGAALTTALLTATLLAVPAVAGATTVPAPTTTFTPGGTVAKSLKRHKVKLLAKKPAKGSKRIVLPVSSGKVHSRSAVLKHRGSLKLKAGKRSVTLRHVRVKVGKTSKVTAKIGRSTITLLTLKPAKKHPAKLDARATSVTLKGATARLPKKTARTLRKKLHLRSLASGRFGKITVTAYLGKVPSPPIFPGPKAPAPPAPLPLDNDVAPLPPAHPARQCPNLLPAREAVDGQIGDAAWALRPTWAAYLSHGGCVVGTDGAEATAADQAHAAFAVTGVTINGDTTTITTQGTVSFVYPVHFIDTQVTNPTFTINTATGAGTVVADGQTSGDRVAAMAGHPAPEKFTRLHVFDVTSSTFADDGDTLSWSDVKVTIAAGDASAIFGYAKGDPFGTFSLSANAKIVPAPILHLKESWAGYIMGAGGSITGEDGASKVSPSNPFEYRYTRGVARTAPDGTVTIDHEGLVRLKYDTHFIDNTIANPTVIVAPDGTSAKVIADGQYSDQANPGDYAPYTRQHILDLDLSAITPTDNDDGTKTYTAAPATVAAGGVATLPGGLGTEWGTFTFSVPSDD